MSEDVKALMLSKWQPIKKMKLKDLKEEVQMWRNIWDWVPNVIKYYISRTGSLVGVQVRNYKRYVGPLLETHWDLIEIEIGVYDKEYDQTSGEYYFERKIVKLPASQIVAFDWIAERTVEEKFAQEEEQEETPELETLEE